MMISNYYNDSLLRRYTSSTNASDTHIFYDCGTNNVLIPEGRSLGCIRHVVMKRFKHTSVSGRGNHDNTNKKSSNSNCMYLYINVYIHTHVHECAHVLKTCSIYI